MFPSSKAQRLKLLEEFLVRSDADGKILALIVDEAHQLSPDLLEEVRLLGNFESNDCKLLQIVLVGQNELNDRLNLPQLWQLKQRIAIRLSLRRLDREAVEEYIRFRWGKAGGEEPNPFTNAALDGIACWSNGIPRLINVICDNALLIAFAETSNAIDIQTIREACEELALPTPTITPRSSTFAGARPFVRPAGQPSSRVPRASGSRNTYERVGCFQTIPGKALVAAHGLPTAPADPVQVQYSVAERTLAITASGTNEVQTLRCIVCRGAVHYSNAGFVALPCTPKNDVAWLNSASGISFGRYGTVFSSGALETTSSAHGVSGSVEVWVQPDHWSGGTILAFYEPESRRLFALQQSLSDLKLETEVQDDENQTAKARLYVGRSIPALFAGEEADLRNRHVRS